MRLLSSFWAESQAWPHSGRMLGLDLGTKTIGIALSDVERRIATPFEVLIRRKFTGDAERLAQIIQTQGVGAIILGLPLNMDGSEGPRSQATRAFARTLHGFLQEFPILFWDERLSTAAVTRALIDLDVSRTRRAAVVDGMAAAYILQGALDFLQYHEA